MTPAGANAIWLSSDGNIGMEKDNAASKLKVAAKSFTTFCNLPGWLGIIPAPVG